MSSKGTKGKWLTLEQKCEVIAQHRREPSANYTQLAQWSKAQFDLSVPPTRQTIRNIIQGAADIEAKRNSPHVTAKGRSAGVRSQELEGQLEQYVNACKETGEQLTRRLLTTRAREILDAMENAPTHNLSVGWLTRFMKRHGLRFQKDRETPPAAAAAVETTQAENGGNGSVAALTTMKELAPAGQEADAERVRVEQLRQNAAKRLREVEKEARELRKYLRRLDEATDVQQQAEAKGAVL